MYIYIYIYMYTYIYIYIHIRIITKNWIFVHNGFPYKYKYIVK